MLATSQRQKLQVGDSPPQLQGILGGRKSRRALRARSFCMQRRLPANMYTCTLAFYFMSLKEHRHLHHSHSILVVAIFILGVVPRL